MKTKLLILFFSVFYIANLFSQEDVLSNPEWMQKKSTVYIELLGNSSNTVSLNLDRIVKQYERQYLNVSLGFGIGANNFLSVPLGLTYTETSKKITASC